MSRTTNNTPKLPVGITQRDLTKPGAGKWQKYREQMAHGKDGQDYAAHEYELWYTERFGWVCPTLLIGKNRRNDYKDRTYAVIVGKHPDEKRGLRASESRDCERGGQCRVGKGPHVKASVTVYVRKSRLEKLQWLIDLYNKGQEGAHDTRDRISTRRANSRRRRQSFESMFGF